MLKIKHNTAYCLGRKREQRNQPKHSIKINKSTTKGPTNKVVVSIFITYIVKLIIVVVTLTDLSLAEDLNTKDKEESLWWKTLSYIGKGADQSTNPAPDLIPYDGIKKLFNENVIIPLQIGFDSPVRNQAHATPYYQTTESFQKWRRDNLMKKIQQNHRVNYPVFMEDLDNVPLSPYKIGGSDVAAPGNWKPIKRLTFTQIASPIVKKHFDPNAHIGKIKVLDTIQTIQHLIDCQAKGHDAVECAKDYGLTFAMSKAVSEVLTIVGQHAGWHFLKDAALGETIVTGASTVGFLAYADYQALQSIVQLVQIRSDTWDDEIKNRLQQERNKRDHSAMWDGTMTQLRTRLDLFSQQFSAKINPANEELFNAWSKAIVSLETIKAKRKELNLVFDTFPSPEELTEKLKLSCETKTEDKTAELTNSHRGEQYLTIEDYFNSMESIISDSKKLIDSCASEEDTKAINNLIKTLRTLHNKTLQAINKVAQSGSPVNNTTVKSSKKNFIDEAAKAKELKTAYQNYITAFDLSVVHTYRTAAAYSDLIALHNNFKARSKRLSSYFRWRSKELLWGSDEKRKELLTSREKALSDFQKAIENFQPKRIPYDSLAGYDRFLKNADSDLLEMSHVGSRLSKGIQNKLDKLKAVKYTCNLSNSSDSLKTYRKRANTLLGEIDKLSKSASSCTFVKIPKLVGLSINEAKQIFKKLNLVPELLESKETNIEPLNTFKIYSQKPSKNSLVKKGSKVLLIYYGPFNKEAKCTRLSGQGARAAYYKQLDKLKKILTEMKKYHCKKTHLTQAEYDSLKKQGLAQKPSPVPLLSDTKSIQKQKKICKTPKGSIPILNHKTGKTKCQCPPNSILTKSKSRGAICLTCKQMKSYYTSSKARGKVKQANKLLKKSRSCPWATKAKHERALESAKAKCRSKLPGSTAILLQNGKPQCVCPKLTVNMFSNNRQLCMSCKKVLKVVNNAFKENRLKDARSIIQNSSTCPWKKEAFQQANKIERQQTEQRRKEEKQALKNKQTCLNIKNKIKSLCNAKQWSSVPSLTTRLRTIPGCKLAKSVAMNCMAGQMHHIASRYNNGNKYNTDNYSLPYPGKFPAPWEKKALERNHPSINRRRQKPSNPSKTNQETIEQRCTSVGCGWCFKVTKRYTRKGRNPNCHSVNHWCPFFTGSKQEFLKFAEREKQKQIARDRPYGITYSYYKLDLVAGPSPKPLSESNMPPMKINCK